MAKFEVRDGIPYLVSKPMSAREWLSKDQPLPDLALYALGWTDAEIKAAKEVKKGSEQ